MFVVSLLASQALAVDWSNSGHTGTFGMVASWDSLGRPIVLNPTPFTTSIVQTAAPPLINSAILGQVPGMINSAILAQVPGMCVDTLEADALINAAILAQVPAMSVDVPEANALINAAIAAQVPAMSVDVSEANALINAAIAAQVPELSLDAFEAGALIDAAILAQVPGLALAEIGAAVPDLVDEMILEQVPELCVDEIDARVPGMIDAAIAAQVPGMTLDAGEAGALIDAAIAAQVPEISVDVAEAGALIDAAIAAQVPDICLDAIDAVVPSLIDAAILDQVPDLALDEIDSVVPEMVADIVPPRTALSFGADHWVAWLQIGASSAGTTATGGNRIVFNLHVEETQTRTYDEFQVFVSGNTANTTALGLYVLDPSGVPGALLWNGPPMSGLPSGAKSTRFDAGTWTAAGAGYHNASGELVLNRGDEVLLAEVHSGNMTLRIFPAATARALGADAVGTTPFTGWELQIPTFGDWPASATAAVGRSGSPPALFLRVKP